MERLFQIIYEDGELLVINKPAGLVCHPTKTDEYSSLISRVRLYLGKDAHPQLINRLDRETSGVTLVAKAEDAARELRRLWENRQVEKEYLAIVHGPVQGPDGVIDAPLGKDEQSRVAIKDCVRADGAGARTRYRVEMNWSKEFQELPRLKSLNGLKGLNKLNGENAPAPCRSSPALVPGARTFSLLRVWPQTGRKHQIRIHLAHIGHPIVGDKLYGGEEDLYLALVEDRLTPEQWQRLMLPYHALHACEVRFAWRGRQMVFRAEPEAWFVAFAKESPFPLFPPVPS